MIVTALLAPARYVICVATYRRPAALASLLESLARQRPHCPEAIIVIDNDAAGSARRVAADAALPVLYAVESRPGIAAARNAALARVPHDCEAVIFIDDDEQAGPDWYSVLTSCYETAGCAVVSGPVDVEIPPGVPRWMVTGGFIQYAPPPDGPTRLLPATNNTIVSWRALQALDAPRFDDSFGLTGGSDTELFWRMREAGATFWWTNAARVHESVDPARFTLRWILRRGVRSGNVLARLTLRRHGRCYTLCSALARLAVGLARTGASLLRGKGLQYADLIYIMRAWGFLGTLRGRLIQEYGRHE